MPKIKKIKKLGPTIKEEPVKEQNLEKILTSEGVEVTIQVKPSAHPAPSSTQAPTRSLSAPAPAAPVPVLGYRSNVPLQSSYSTTGETQTTQKSADEKRVDPIPMQGIRLEDNQWHGPGNMEVAGERKPVEEKKKRVETE